MCASSCSSLPSGTGEANPLEHDGSLGETSADDEAQPDETPSLAEAGDGTEAADEDVADITEDDVADIQRRAEEDLAYLDSPVSPDLPEPVYLFPDDEAADAEPAPESGEPDQTELADNADPPFDAEPAPESGEPDQTELADNADPPLDAEPEAPADPQTEIADSTTAGEGDDSGPAETLAAEEAPPPPASLLPPREISAAPPPRPPVSAMPVSLPQQPARVPPSETERESGEKDAPPIERTIQATVGENVEVSLPGSGWVYLGEAREQKGLSYQRRRVSADGQVFVFKPEKAGSYRLSFKKQDLLRGTDTDALIEVTVVEKAQAAVPADIAAAERAVPEKAVSKEAGENEKAPLKDASALVPAPDTELVSGEGEPPFEPSLTAMIDKADPATVAVIDDAALWNRGRELEAPGANRNMKGALAAYKTLVRDYPQSEYYSGSQKRIAYIERFFVNIQ
jgi:hypothetical protein